MAVVALRVHVAVTDGRQGLDRKEEELQEAFGPDIGDRPIAEIENRVANTALRKMKTAAAEAKNASHRTIIA